MALVPLPTREGLGFLTARSCGILGRHDRRTWRGRSEQSMAQLTDQSTESTNFLVESGKAGGVPRA